MTKLQLTYELSCEFTSALGYPVATGDAELNILCLEGAAPLPELEGLIGLNPNAPDLYNDCVVLFWREADELEKNEGVLRVLRGVLRVLRATTEPGRYYTRIDPHPGGAAHLVWGHHAYKRGRHRGKPALVSASGLDRVWRDRDGDFSQDMTERVYIGRFGIHVHAGGTAQSIGRWSAGCIAIHGGYEGEPYLFLLDRIERHPARLFNLVLWGARDLGRWVKDKEGWRPTLRYGIRNPWVARMQKLLESHTDARLTADSDWGPRTQEVFLRFQRKTGLVVDGICGPLSWGALESNEPEVC
jgi:hypothetical protein